MRSLYTTDADTIADILFDAHLDIRRCLATTPHRYAEHMGEIRALLVQMRHVRRLVGNPFFALDDPAPQTGDSHEPR
jgi:hypothetical protein